MPRATDIAFFLVSLSWCQTVPVHDECHTHVLSCACCRRQGVEGLGGKAEGRKKALSRPIRLHHTHTQIPIRHITQNQTKPLGSFDPEIPPEAQAQASSTTVSVPKEASKDKSFLDTLKDNIAQVGSLCVCVWGGGSIPHGAATGATTKTKKKHVDTNPPNNYIITKQQRMNRRPGACCCTRPSSTPSSLGGSSR